MLIEGGFHYTISYARIGVPYYHIEVIDFRNILRVRWISRSTNYSRLPKIDTFSVPPKIRKCVNLWEKQFLG